MNGQHQHLHFYDSANSRSVPSGVHAGVYINGAFRWSHAEQQRMSGIFSISVLREPGWARLARCIDVEAGAGLPPDVVPFIRERAHLGFDDGTVYTNRSNREQVGNRLADAGLEALEWCATLDGTISLQPVRGLKLWAIQYSGGFHAPFDQSILLGVDNFHKP